VISIKSNIKVLVVDDSAFMRYSITKHLSADPMITVVGSARDGEDALKKIPVLQPDVVTLDVEMPVLDGIGALEQIMASFPRPVIMVSSLTQRGTRTTIRALMRGAVDFIAKPATQSDIGQMVSELAEKIKIVANVNRPAMERHIPIMPASSAAPLRSNLPKPASRSMHSQDPLVVIGSSTGGPRALDVVLTNLAGDLDAAFLVVQHMPSGFSKSLAERLNEVCPLNVREAAEGDTLAKGQVLFAPGDYHMVLGEGYQIHLNQAPRVNHVRPAVDVTLESAARIHGNKIICTILTGMGSDGTVGAVQVKLVGGYVIAEDASTCVVYGMPRSVVEAGAAHKVLPLQEIGPYLVRLIREGVASVDSTMEAQA
jgi:two-component system, chemotaxis family, protein-glutamate methylesterase/glutaminase